MSLDRRTGKRLSALDPELIERVRYLAVVSDLIRLPEPRSTNS